MAQLHEAANIILTIFAVYGIATVVADYAGPFAIFDKLREIKPLSSLLSCNVCLTPYIAFVFFIALDMPLLAYLAVVGAVVLLARLS